jgi:hypothetical protein
MSLIRTYRRKILRQNADSKKYEFAVDKSINVIHSAKKRKNRNTLCNLKRFMPDLRKKLSFITSNESSIVVENLENHLYRLCPICTALVKLGKS